MYAPCVPHRTAVPTDDLALASRFSIKHSIVLWESKGDTFVGRDFGFGVSVYHVIENNPINKPFFRSQIVCIRILGGDLQWKIKNRE